MKFKSYLAEDSLRLLEAEALCRVDKQQVQDDFQQEVDLVNSQEALEGTFRVEEEHIRQEVGQQDEVGLLEGKLQVEVR